jgi:hypothetical protein
MTAPLKIIAVLLMFLVPGLAMAGVIMPPGGTDWDMYVYGNGRVIFDILNSVKMLVAPSGGGAGFKTLMLLLATIGFVVLAVSAGFDPGKNLLKMFGYIMTVWFVSYATTGLTANIVVQDLSRSTGVLGVDPVYRIDAVPALIVMPAVLTSMIGKYFTTSIETYFTLPHELKMSGGAVGQYNLFGRMMQESSQYTITSPELKRSVAQYIGDCTIPAIAMGKLKGTVHTDNPNSPTAEGYGANALLRSQNLWLTLKSARNKSIITTYYPFDAKDSSWMTLAGAELDGVTKAGSTEEMVSSGVLVSCDSAYNILDSDIKNYANLLLEAGSDSWSRTGVQVTFQGAMQTVLAHSGAVGSAAQPSAYIMQTAFLNTMSGSFRQAAAQTGNSASMIATQMAIAEQSQWSAWSAGFSTFNNMMGYVFTVLQAFIFAITPIVIVALIIPGMGKAIFVNYAQILVWLTLWMPMLAIINFLITLYGSDSISMVVSSEGGPSMANRALISQAVNHQMLAAQFLGGMVPMIAWGLVKGGMAFTEFINAGVGNQFAAAAGAGAATGNLSMNNMSMDNTSMNKFSTMSSSQVGNQAVSSGMGLGSVSGLHDQGGQGTSANNANVSMKQALQSQLASGIKDSKAVSEQISAINTQTTSSSDLLSLASGSSNDSSQTKAAQQVLQAGLQAAVDRNAITKEDAARTMNNVVQAATTQQSSSISFVEGVVKGSLPVPLVSISGGAGGRNDRGDGNNSSTAGSDGSGAGRGDGVSTGHKSTIGLSKSDIATAQRAFGDRQDTGERASRDRQASMQDAVQRAKTNQDSVTATFDATRSVTSSMDFAGAVGAQDYAQMQSHFDKVRSGMKSEAEMAQTMTSMVSRLDGNVAKNTSDFDNLSGKIQARAAELKGDVKQSASFAGTPTDKSFTAGVVAVEEKINQATSDVRAKYETAQDNVNKQKKNSAAGYKDHGVGALTNGKIGTEVTTPTGPNVAP